MSYNAEDVSDNILGKYINSYIYFVLVNFGTLKEEFLNYCIVCCTDPKGELGSFLDGLAVADNVPNYLKEHPFGSPEITSDHLDWSYYSKILRFIK